MCAKAGVKRASSGGSDAGKRRPGVMLDPILMQSRFRSRHRKRRGPMTIKFYFALASLAVLAGALIGYAEIAHSNSVLREMLSDWPRK
jgi:hypothetical protein